MSGIELNHAEQRQLLAWARETLRRHLCEQGAAPEALDFPAALTQPAGAFVTLHLGHELRGCIGSFQAEGTLAETVREMAVAAATHDPRFPPVPRGELDLLTIEISVLSPRWVSSDPLHEIVIGRHGIFVTRSWHRGVLLPQVATEYGWDPETFLVHTCRKAGLPDGAWKQPDTLVELFTAQVFGEDDGSQAERMEC